MIAKAKEYNRLGEFEAAFNSASAAMRYSEANKGEAEALIEEIFIKINQLRTEAIDANKLANEATRKALESAEIAKRERSIAFRAKIEADISRQVAEKALDSVRVLAEKGQQLERTFSDSNAYQYLYQTGLHHFMLDTLSQSRDYRTALTYFALARFLKPSNTLRYLVDAAQIGINAEASFIAGNLDSAQFLYNLIEAKLDSAKHESLFEKLRMEQIVEVEKLYWEFKQKYGEQVPKFVELEGNWWTLPYEFGVNQDIVSIDFNNNSANFEQFPGVLGMLPNLDSLAITNCPNVRELKNWSELKHLRSLSFHDNLNLYAVENLGSLEWFSHFSATNCPALTVIRGCEKLKDLVVRQSPQARVSALVYNNHQLRNLELSDLPDGSLDISKLGALESLSLARMKASNLQGLERNNHIKVLRIDALQSDSSFTLKPPDQLTSAYIQRCNALLSLGAWPASDSLSTLILSENNSLETLPDWKNFPKLKILLIQNCEKLSRVPGTMALDNIHRVFLLKNPNLITNSLQAGFGFDWGPNLSSVKLEYEHRRRMHSRFVKNQDFGFKAVGLYSWKKFYNPSPGIVKNSAEGAIAGAVVSYYSPYLIFTGIGMGVASLRSRFSDEHVLKSTHFVWINNLGVQIAPYFPRKDKVSLNMDLYTIFSGNDYFILPSFGLSYHHTLGFHRKTLFIRPNDSRTHVVAKGHNKNCKRNCHKKMHLVPIDQFFNRY